MSSKLFDNVKIKDVDCFSQGNPTLFFATFLLTTRVSLLHARARTRFFS